MRALTQRDDDILNGTNAIVGLILLLSPWVFGFAATKSANWTAGTGGIVIGVISLAALARRAEWHEWVVLAAGLCLVVSPWVFDFAEVITATIIHIIVGGLSVALAAIEIWRCRSTPPATPA